MAGQAHVDLKVEVTIKSLDLVHDVLLRLGRVTTGPQQGQHQGGKFVAQRQAGKAQAGVRADALQAEGRLAGIRAVKAHTDLVGAQALDSLQQCACVAAGFAVVKRRHHLEGLGHAFQVSGQLAFECFVEHGGFLLLVF